MASVIIVGAGPAGASLALLLAERGIDVTLIERRRDFSREFRGEILIPSGRDALEQMGVTPILEEVPTHTLPSGTFYINGNRLFDVAFDTPVMQGQEPLALSQPVFLETLVARSQRRANFRFERGVSVRELTQSQGRITGVTIREGNQERTLQADLVIGADGRNSLVRRLLKMDVVETSVPMDIVWCKLPRPSDWQGLHAYFGSAHLLVAYHTWDDSLQLGWVILKGEFGDLRSRGVEAWVDVMAHHVSPELGAHLQRHQAELERPFLLDSESDRVIGWSRPGALVIGDAAHTMSPVGGQGINVALRDAIVAANHLVPVLRERPDHAALDAAAAKVEPERLPEIERIQRLQAQPPRLVLSRAWWGEPLRRLASRMLRSSSVRARLAQRLTPALFGVTPVQLKV